MWDDLKEKDPKMEQIRAEIAAKGKAVGLIEGEVKGLQNAVVKVVRGRFPSLTELAQQKVVQVNAASVLYYMIDLISTASDEALVRWLLRPSAA